MKIAVAGTGYVGLVTGVTLAHLGNEVWCTDVDKNKIDNLNNGECPIYEEGLQELMIKNKERLHYTLDYNNAYKNADVIYIGVGTPENEDGTANLTYVYNVCDQIVQSIEKDCVVVIKSTVPIGTNSTVEEYLRKKINNNIKIDVVSNPEFLAQGTAVRDTLYATRIVIGADSEKAAKTIKSIYEPLNKEPYNVPILEMDRQSAEMVKYASNNFLALKISYINEIANLCESLNANIENVTRGMGYDYRIGNKFLRAGIGYGGSCLPKDTKALYSLSKELGKDLSLVDACIKVNEKQRKILIEKLKEDFEILKGLKIGILGLTFKPETDDLRQAPAKENIDELLKEGCVVTAYDPIGMKNFKNEFDLDICYAKNEEEAIKDMDAVMIFTEWEQFRNMSPDIFKKLMKNPNVYDGRNCFDIQEMKELNINYKSIGR